MRIFVTGMSGFIGSHLAAHLVAEGHDVWGTYYVKSEVGALDAVRKKLHLLYCDIRSLKQVDAALRKSRPERIYHLAAQSFPTVSWSKPALTMATNAGGTINLFEAVKALRLDTRVVVAGSSAIYGYVNEDEVPVNEDHPLRPLHPYGVSKVAQELLAYQYYKNFGIWSATARIFNTTGPGKVHDVCADFASQVARIEAGRQRNPMRVGNLSPRRDITDVRDQVRGLEAIVEKGKPGEPYNLCSSHSIAIQYVLGKLLSLAQGKVDARVDQKLLRPTDEPIIMGDNTKLVRATGWKPKIAIARTLEDSLDHWREKFKR